MTGTIFLVLCPFSCFLVQQKGCPEPACLGDPDVSLECRSFPHLFRPGEAIRRFMALRNTWAPTRCSHTYRK